MFLARTKLVLTHNKKVRKVKANEHLEDKILKKVKEHIGKGGDKKSYTPVDPDWDGETAYIIGGGISLRDFDFERIRGRRTIAVNRSACYLPWASAFFTIDTGRNYNHTLDELKEKQFSGEKWVCVNSEEYARIRYDEGVRYVRKIMDYGIANTSHYIFSNFNSGAAAINLAVHKGCKRIILLGVDMLKGPYWYDPEAKLPMNIDRPWTHPTYQSGKVIDRTKYINQVNSGFDKICKDAQAKGVRIYNASPISTLTCFPRMKHNEVYAL
jgi:hypothetical protein